MQPWRSVRRRLARWLLAGARSRVGGWLAAFACARVPRLLPVERLALTPAIVAFRHPRPESRDHVVLVPRHRAASLTALVEARRHDRFVALLEVAGALAASRVAADGEERVLAINLGGRQDVAQLHAHLMPARGLRRALAETIEERAVDPRDAAEVLRALGELGRRIAVAGGRWGGSVLVRDFASGAGSSCIRLAATVTPTEERPALD